MVRNTTVDDAADFEDQLSELVMAGHDADVAYTDMMQALRREVAGIQNAEPLDSLFN